MGIEAIENILPQLGSFKPAGQCKAAISEERTLIGQGRCLPGPSLIFSTHVVDEEITISSHDIQEDLEVEDAVVENNTVSHETAKADEGIDMFVCNNASSQPTQTMQLPSKAKIKQAVPVRSWLPPAGPFPTSSSLAHSSSPFL